MAVGGNESADAEGVAGMTGVTNVAVSAVTAAANRIAREVGTRRIAQTR